MYIRANSNVFDIVKRLRIESIRIEVSRTDMCSTVTKILSKTKPIYRGIELSKVARFKRLGYKTYLAKREDIYFVYIRYDLILIEI